MAPSPKDCYIAGHVDFIFDNAAAVFDRCDIHSKGDGYLTAVNRTSADQPTGYVFYKCRITGENQTKGSYLGRPWRPHARVVYIDCSMDAPIRPEGWDNWKDANNEATAWYGEIGCTGPGAKTADRVRWSRQLSPAEAAPFLPDVFLRGNDGWSGGWNPAADRP